MLVCSHNGIDYVESKPKQVAKATAAFDFCGISEGIGCDVSYTYVPNNLAMAEGREKGLRQVAFVGVPVR